jgi:hypothetical protein
VEACRRLPCSEVDGLSIDEPRGTCQVVGGGGSPKWCADGEVVEDGSTTLFNGSGDRIRWPELTLTAPVVGGEGVVRRTHQIGGNTHGAAAHRGQCWWQ